MFESFKSELSSSADNVSNDSPLIKLLPLLENIQNSNIRAGEDNGSIKKTGSLNVRRVEERPIKNVLKDISETPTSTGGSFEVSNAAFNLKKSDSCLYSQGERLSKVQLASRAPSFSRHKITEEINGSVEQVKELASRLAGGGFSLDVGSMSGMSTLAHSPPMSPVDSKADVNNSIGKMESNITPESSQHLVRSNEGIAMQTTKQTKKKGFFGKMKDKLKEAAAAPVHDSKTKKTIASNVSPSTTHSRQASAPELSIGFNTTHSRKGSDLNDLSAKPTIKEHASPHRRRSADNFDSYPDRDPNQMLDRKQVLDDIDDDEYVAIVPTIRKPSVSSARNNDGNSNSSRKPSIQSVLRKTPTASRPNSEFEIATMTPPKLANIPNSNAPSPPLHTPKVQGSVLPEGDEIDNLLEARFF